LQAIYDFPLNSNPGWTADADWAFGPPTGSCGDPPTAFTGSNVYGYNLAGCYPNGLSPVRYLTTTSLNLTGVINTSLEFRRWLGVEQATFDHATIDVSPNNGSSWTNIYSNPVGSGLSVNDTSWSLQTYSLTTADGQAAVKIRWGMGTTDGSVVFQGWNIDDIQVKGLRPPVLGDVNNDGVHNTNDAIPFVAVLLGLDTNELHVSRSDVNLDGKADGKDVQTWIALP